jgi:outer membrane scaffolding protein for murein synthesis (MipA/OmpV family)
MAIARSGLSRLAFPLALLWAAGASAQTPSPFAHWQDAAGIMLAPLAGPIPDWRITLGLGGAFMPVYEGSRHYRILPAPAIDIRYKDIAFLSLGDGLGVNVFRGETYRVGVAVGYDFGRDEDVASRLNGLGTVEASPEFRVFAEVRILPFILTADLRRAIGGHGGSVGDLGVYLPVIGRENLVVFIGPSITFANDRYMQAYFGVGTAQAMASTAHLPRYDADGGLKSASFGASTIYHFNEHWFVDADIAWERLADTAGNSPIVEQRNQFGLSMVVGYEF